MWRQSSFTNDVSLRGTKKIPLKEITDEALKTSPSIEKVFVQRVDLEYDTPMTEDRDFYLEDSMMELNAECEAEALDSEDPLFILYTSGSTGKPKVFFTPLVDT